MKKYIIAILSLVVLSTSCSDYLDKAPEGKLPQGDGTDFSKTENMFQPTAGIYAKAGTANGFSRWALLGIMVVRGDDMNKGGSTVVDQGELNTCKEFKYAQIRDYWAIKESWKGLYNLVQQSNEALVTLDKYAEHLTTGEQIKLNNQYKAEVRFIRAYAYFFITRMWGDVPVFTNNKDVFVSNDVFVENLHKTPRLEVYKFINDELNFILDNDYLPAVRPNEMPLKGQVTKYTALALKAKANADISEWQAVIDATEAIIGSGKFTLFTDYYQYFKKPGRLADETLFELQYTDFGNGSGESVGSDLWFEFQGPNNMQGANPMTGGWGFITPTDKIVKLFEDRGETVRYQTTILKRRSLTAEGDSIRYNNVHPYYNGKAYLPSTQLTPGREAYGMGNNIRMLRYADVLLLNAEAKVNKGQNGDTSFNLVRTRANMPTLTNVTVDQILEERQIEFACEWGERFFDLVRTNKAEGILDRFEAGKHEFYPIPQEQINLNPNLAPNVK